jgi:replication initiation and membrane attachment protein DnaB
MAGGGVYDRKAKGAFNEKDSDALDSLNRELNLDERVSNVLIDIADGVHFVVKN